MNIAIIMVIIKPINMGGLNNEKKAKSAWRRNNRGGDLSGLDDSLSMGREFSGS